MTPESEYPICRGVSLGENIRVHRLKRKLQQKDLAKKLGVPPSCVSDWEAGKTSPRMKTLGALAGVLGTTVAKLVA